MVDLRKPDQPTIYRPEMVRQGASMADIAGISKSTSRPWLDSFPDFPDASRARAREKSDALSRQRLYARADSVSDTVARAREGKELLISKSTKVGRPTKYDPAMCEKVIELGRQGKSLAGIADALGIARQTLYAWADSNPNFLDAISRARGAAQEYFEDIGNKHMVEEPGGAKLNTDWVMLQMKNRFREDYGD